MASMTDQEFRHWLEARGWSQSSFARLMIELGDPRPFASVLRSISGYANGERSVPAELAVILRLIERNGIRAPAALKRGRPPKAATPG